jgi:hypothetical protein
MTVQQSEQLPVSADTLDNRFPFQALYSYLGRMWKNEFHTDSELITEEGMFGAPNSLYFPYDQSWPVLGVAMERAATILQSRNTLPKNQSIFTVTPREIVLRNNAEEGDFNNAVKEHVLAGVSALCVGGIEGRVLHNFGATVVNVDPHIGVIGIKKTDGISEFAENFSQDLINKIPVKTFDIALAKSVFDSGSGVMEIKPDNIMHYAMGGELDSNMILFYQMLSALKSKGYLIVDGNMVPKIISKYGLVQDAAYIAREGEDISNSGTVWTIQKSP